MLSNNNPKKFKAFNGQSYAEIKAQLLSSKKLFRDSTFPPNAASLARFKPVAADIVWKRPHEFCGEPQPEFIIGEINAADIVQGVLGNCWFMSAFAAVSTSDFIHIVIPKDQVFQRGSYTGIFRFRFWRFGEWIEVVVDDYLPVSQLSNQLTFCRNVKDAHEMFAPLLEKAYAKLNSCYEFLDGGDDVEGRCLNVT